MAECKACKQWFGTSTPTALCPTCERALKRLGEYVEPVKHGRWLNAVDEDPELYGWVPLDTVLCSACRKIDKENSRKTPRCPSCGAKMDKEINYYD